MDDEPASVTCSEKRKQSNTHLSQEHLNTIKKNKQKKPNRPHAVNCGPTCWLPFEGLTLCIQFTALNTMKCLDSTKEPQKDQANLGPLELAGKLLKASHKLPFVH